MQKKVILAIFLILSAGIFLYGNFNHKPEAETIKTFSEDENLGDPKIHDGKPVYIAGDYTTNIYYKGKTHGKRFDSTGGASLIDGKLVFEATNKNRDLLVVNGKVRANTSETIREYDLLDNSPVYISGPYEKNKTLYHGKKAIRNFTKVEEMKVIGGKIAVLASNDYDDFLWYNGSIIDRKAASFDLKNYKNKPLYQINTEQGYGLALEGEKLDMNGSIDGFEVIEDKLAVEYENGTKFIEGKNISKCGKSYKLNVVEGKFACVGQNESKIYHGNEVIETGYDLVHKPFEHNGSLAYIANHNGASLIASRNKILTENYSVIFEAISYNNSLYYTGGRQGKANVYRDGNKITNFTIATLESEEKPLISGYNMSQKLYIGNKPVKTAEWIEEPLTTEKGLTYQYYKNGKTTLVTPRQNISRYGYVIDYGYGDKGLAYLTHKNYRNFLVYDDSKSFNYSGRELNFINGTPYFQVEKNGNFLLMEGHSIHTNLSEEALPDFIDEEEKEKDYERIEEDNEIYIKIEGEKHGPFEKSKESSYYPFLDKIRQRNDTVALIESRKSEDYLYYNGKRYGPYDQIESYQMTGQKIFFKAIEDEKQYIKKITQ